MIFPNLASDVIDGHLATDLQPDNQEVARCMWFWRLSSMQSYPPQIRSPASLIYFECHYFPLSH